MITYKCSKTGNLILAVWLYSEGMWGFYKTEGRDGMCFLSDICESLLLIKISGK